MPDYLHGHGPGAVRNLETDRRLKRNRSMPPKTRTDILHGAQGRVKNPEQDRRLKRNRTIGNDKNKSIDSL